MRILNLFSSLFVLLILTQGCWHYDRLDDDEAKSTYKPIYMSREELESSIKLSEVKTMIAAGKIYVKDNFIFITDENRGFHIYDNSQPSTPKLIGFLEAPGVTDMAIKNNTIYINQATDLVALSVNQKNVVIHKRIPNTFPQKLSPDGINPQKNDDNIIVNWEKNKL